MACISPADRESRLNRWLSVKSEWSEHHAEGRIVTEKELDAGTRRHSQSDRSKLEAVVHRFKQPLY